MDPRTSAPAPNHPAPSGTATFPDHPASSGTLALPEGPLPYFDAHCDTLSRCLATGEHLVDAAGQCSLNRLARYQPFGQVFAIFQDAAKLPAEIDPFSLAKRQAALFAREKALYPDLMERCVLSVEGGELLSCDPDRLQDARNWGVRLVNLTWNHANALSGSHCDCPDRGLTDQGRAFARRAWDLGIVPDVSHLSDPGFFDLAELGGVLIASHSNSRAICPHTRNLTDDQFRLIRDRGGVVGINLYTDFVGGRGAMEDLLRHFDHFLDLDGERTLALGSDWDGGITGAGGIAGAKDMGKLAEAMLRRGYGSKLVRRIFYGNLAAFLGFASEPGTGENPET